MGVSPPEMAQSEDQEDHIPVFAENCESLTAFLKCQTQWRTAPHGHGYVLLGLDYSAVELVLRRMVSRPRVFDDVQEMELAALAAFGEMGR